MICVFFPISHVCTERERGEKRDRQIVLHLQYVSELVAMQQDWESVEEGGWEDGDSFVERKEWKKEGSKEAGKRGVLECKLEKKGVLSRDNNSM